MSEIHYETDPSGKQHVWFGMSKDDYDYAGNFAQRLFAKWSERFLIPRNTSGHTGVVLSIRHSGEKKDSELFARFVRDLDNYLKHSKSPSPIKLLVLPNSVAKRVDGQDNRDRSSYYMYKAKAQVVVYGNFIRANTRGIPSVNFSWNATVLHTMKPAKSVSDTIRELLPISSFPEGGENEGFVAMSKWLGWVIKYIIAVGATLTQDPDVAEKMYKELESELSLVKDPRFQVQRIQSRLPSGFRDIEKLRVIMAKNPKAANLWREVYKLKTKKTKIIDL